MKEMIPHHGGNIYEEADKAGISPEEILDFSANINPLGIPQILRDSLHRNIEHLINYPDPHCKNLKNSISRYLEVDKEQICVGNGASELIYLIFSNFKFNKVLFAAPTFCEYENAAKASNTECVFIERQESDGYSLNFSNLLSTALQNKVGAILICNPNNPTSTLETKENILELIKRCSEQGIYVIIDEAFIELTVGGNSNSVVKYAEEFEKLIIIRAFTKMYAVPGLRLGYSISSKRIAKLLEDAKITWSVNLLAAEAGCVLSDVRYIEETQDWLKTELHYMHSELCKFTNIKVFKPSTNFVLCKTIDGSKDAQELREKLMEQGILIRNASNFKFLDKYYFRVAVKDRSSNDKLIKALEVVLI